MTILNGGSRKFYLSTVVMWMAVMSLVALFAFGAVPNSTNTKQHDPPKAKGYTCAVSVDEFVRVCYDADTTTIPPVERYAFVFAFVDGFFVSVERVAPVHIYIHSYKKFQSRMSRLWPDMAVQVAAGQQVLKAVTYMQKGSNTIIIEAYEILPDDVLVHELLHHYFGAVVIDGSLNAQHLVEGYTHHVLAMMRYELAKRY